MKMSLIGVWLLGFHFGLVFGQEPSARTAKGASRGYAAGYKAGVAEADKELEEGTATIYEYGTRELALDFLDRETRLPYEIIAGCTVTQKIKARADGHNDRIRKYIDERGLPGNSFKRWDKELFDLKRYYENRAPTERVHRLTRDGPIVKSSGGKYKIRMVKAPWKRVDGSVEDVSFVVVSTDGVDHKALIVPGLLHSTNADLLWGPKESGFAVIHCNGNDDSFFVAVDLNRGKLLRGGSK
jgi:hypothetical protein